jgi:hypothetical protein
LKQADLQRMLQVRFHVRPVNASPECAMSPLVNIAVHAVTAGVFFFGLQYHFNGETFGISLIWAAAAAAGAAGLAYAQSRKGL